MIRVGMVVTKETAPYQQEFIKLFEPIADVVSFNQVHQEVQINDDEYIGNDGRTHKITTHKFADSQLWQRMTINYDGETEICCENYKQEYSLGNIKDYTVPQIWRGKRFEAVRSLHQEGKWWAVPQCRKCTIPWMG